MATNNISGKSYPSSNNNIRKPIYNDSFDQPAEPFECDVSAIYPASNTSLLTETELDNDDEDEDDDIEDDEISLHQTQPLKLRPQDLHTRKHDPKLQQQQAALSARYLEAGTDWPPQYDDGDYISEQEEQYYYQNELGSQQHQQQQQQQQQQQHHPQQGSQASQGNSYVSQQQLDDEPVGGIARLSTIAEVSELNSLNITNNRHASHRNTPPHSGQQVITRDLVLEDLYVDGQDDKDEEMRQRLLANLKPTDILGPLHETRDFKISSLTGTDPDGNPVGPQHHHHSQYEPERSLIIQGDESDLSANALALKREFEALFPNGAIDSERSGSEGSDDDYYQDEDDDGEDDDDPFSDDDEEEDEEEEQFYAMLDMGGGNGNMILGNNIPRKPRVIAPPPGSRLPVPGAGRQNPSPSQTTPLKRSPVPRPTPPPPASAAPSPPAPPVQPAQPPPVAPTPRAPPTIGLRKPMFTAKKANPASVAPPAPPQDLEMNGTKPHGGILDDLYKEPVFDEHPEESPGAIYAAQVAKELMREKQRSQLRTTQIARPSMLKPPSRLPQRPAIDISADMMEDEVEEEEEYVMNAPPVETHATSGIPRTITGTTTLTRSPSAAAPTKVPSSSLHTVTRTTTRTTTTTQSLSPSGVVARSSPKLAHKSSLPSVATSTPSSAASSPRPTTGSTAGREPLSARTATPTRSLSGSASKPRPATMYSTAPERSPVVSRTASPVNAVRMSSHRSSMYEQPNRDVYSDQPLKQSASRDSIRGKGTFKDAMPSPRERPDDLVRRPSYERRRNLQRGQELDVEEADLEHVGTPRKLAVRTMNPREDLRRSGELQPGYRRSMDRERTRDQDSSVPPSPRTPHSTSPRTPISHSPRSGFSSKRSSIYGGLGINGDRAFPTIEEASQRLADLNQDVMDIRDKIYQKRNGSTTSNLGFSGTARMSTVKRPAAISTTGGRDREREREREEGLSSNRSSFDGKYSRDTRPQHGRSQSFDSNEPLSPGGKYGPSTPGTSAPRGGGIAEVLGKFKRNAVHSSPPAADSGLGSSQLNKTPTSSTFPKGRMTHSTSQPLLRSRRAMGDPEPSAPERPHGHQRTPSFGTLGRSASYRMATQPSTPMVQKYPGEDRYHSGGSSGQSEEFSDELPHDPRHGYSHQGQHGHYQFYDRPQPLTQYSDHPPYQEARRSSGSSGDSVCPAQIRPKELQFPYNVEGEMEATVTLYNRSRRYVRFEILQPRGITITPTEGVIPSGADKRLTVRVAANRGPGRVVVELDGEWLVPFGVSFK
ncbi:hypothetical protein BGX31_006748 [Mortierella sp. GBA43]|nr:hypothetical protein BGX31_006748 [Mortierella sp. GBA43]